MFGRGRFFAHAMRGFPFERGDLKYVILDLIKEKPRYGYEVIRAIEEHSHGFYAPSPGVIYPTLQMLEEMGYVKSSQEDGKKIYTITEDGRRFLEEKKQFTEGIKEHVRHHWSAERMYEMGETMGELRKLGQLLGRQLRHADPDKVRRVREIISRACSEIEAVLQQ